MKHTAPTASRDASLPCREQDPELWWSETAADVEQAKAACLGCPIRAACLTGALERHEPAGVWGGELFVRGAIVPSRRPKRPARDCGWCDKPIPAGMRKDAQCCSGNCRKARNAAHMASVRAARWAREAA